MEDDTEVPVGFAFVIAAPGLPSPKRHENEHGSYDSIKGACAGRQDFNGPVDEFPRRLRPGTGKQPVDAQSLGLAERGQLGALAAAIRLSVVWRDCFHVVFPTSSRRRAGTSIRNHRLSDFACRCE
jgi:hypothetical protein